MERQLNKDLLRRILGQLDESDPFIRRAILSHLADCKQELAREIPPERILHVLSHPRTIDAWVLVNVHNIRYRAALLRLEDEKKQFEQAKQEMLEKMPIYERAFEPADAFQLNLFRLEVLTHEPEPDLNLAWEVIRCALQLSRLAPEEMSNFQHPFVSDENLGPFFSDLVKEFRSSEQSRESIPKLVEDAAFAKKLASLSEDIVARPIRFLAGIRRDAGDVIPTIIQESLAAIAGYGKNDAATTAPEPGDVQPPDHNQDSVPTAETPAEPETPDPADDLDFPESEKLPEPTDMDANPENAPRQQPPGSPDRPGSPDQTPPTD